MRAYTKVLADGEVVVKVQLSKKMVARICWYFGTKEIPVFASCEFLAQGYGWYLVIGRCGCADGATKGMKHIAVALSATLTRKQLRENATAESHLEVVGRAVVRARQNHGHRIMVVVSRKTSAKKNKDKEITAEIAALMGKAVNSVCIADKLAAFNNKHHYQ